MAGSDQGRVAKFASNPLRAEGAADSFQESKTNKLIVFPELYICCIETT